MDSTSVIARTYGIGPAPVLPEYVFPIPAKVGQPLDLGTYNVVNNPIMRASPGTNWWKAIFRKAPLTEQNINISGGTDRGRYFFSVNYFNQQGTMRYTDYRKYTTRANTEFKVKAFTFGENMTVGFSNGVGQPSGNQVEQSVINQGLLKMQPIIPVYDIEGGWGGTRAGFGNGDNGLAQLYRNKDNRGESFRLLGNVYGEVKFLNHFTGRINYGIDYGNNFSKGFSFINYEANERAGANAFRESTQRLQRWIFSQQLTYDNQFGDHTVRATAVHEAQLNKFRQISGSLNNYFLESQDLWYLNTALADPATRSVSSSGSIDNAKESYLGRVEYGFKGRYLINGTARYDQSSNFALNKGQLFGGVGLAWRVSDEAFMQQATWVSDLKLRAAYGVTGNDAIPGSVNYSSYGGGAGSTFYAINGSNTSATTGYTATQFGLPVRWEKQKQIDVGIDALFLHNRLELSVDYYRRQNADFLFQPDVPGTFPYDVGKPYRNIGRLSNKGVEFSSTWRAGAGKDFKYDATLNLTFNKNRIDELAPEFGLTSFFPAIPESRIGPLVRHYQGRAMGTFYGLTLDGIYQNQAEVDKGPEQSGKKIGRFRWKDISGPDGKPDGKIDDNDKGPIGDPNPKIVFGLNVNLSYKNFDFTMFLQGTQGNEIFNYSRYFTDFFGFSGNRSKRMLYESWTPTRTNAKLPLLDITDNSYLPSTYYIEDGSYIRAKVVQLGYKLPTKLLSRVGVDNARIYLQAQNLFTITKYGGLDPTLGTRDEGNAPEQWSGVDYANYPSSKVLMVGVNLSF
ncbi:MAG: SusC/RagA family TonB-linked outer membrane protein [Segetibacter sp.]